MKLAAMPAMSGLREDGVERLELVGGGKHRASHQPLEVGAFGDQGVELAKRVGDGVGLAIVLGERKQGGGVASGYARNDRVVVLCQARHLSKAPKAHAAPLPEGGANPRNS